MSRTKKVILIASGVVLLAALGGGGYAIKHNADVKAAERAARQARIDRVNRQYRDDLAKWKADDAEWQRKQSDYSECQSATSTAFDAADAVSGRIVSGGKYDEYQSDLTEFATSVSSAIRQSSDNFDCLMVVEKLEQARNRVNKGMNVWLSWMQGDSYQYVDSVDDLPGVDTQFTKAQDKISDAQSALSDMEPPGSEPEKPTRGHRYVAPLEL
jgi:hypothetical protein